MSLKARLRISIVALVAAVVIALAALLVPPIVESKFDDLSSRSEFTSRQVRFFVMQRLNERAQESSLSAGVNYRAYWTSILQQDQIIKTYLATTMADSGSGIIEIQLLNREGKVIVSNMASSEDHPASNRILDYRSWRQESLWRRLYGLLATSESFDLSISDPFGTPREELFAVRVLLSKVFLREAIRPQLRDLGILSGASLLVSIILAYLFTNLALRPLAIIGERIDEIAGGTRRPDHPEDDPVKEVAVVQSKLKLLGEQFRDARANAQQLRTNVDQLLQRLEEAVLLFDPQGRLVMAGRPAERLLGRSQAELMGKSWQEIFPSQSPEGRAIQRALNQQQPLHDRSILLERRGQASSRLVLNLEILDPVADQPSMGTLITLRDADSRREIYSQLDVSSRLAAINRLTSGVAHEIKNPLNAIRLHLEVLRGRLQDEPDAQPSLQVIEKEIVRLDKVVKTFLDFTRPVQFKLGEVELHAMAQEVINLVQPAAQQRKVELWLDPESVPVVIRGDHDTLKQALLNLVINGIDAMTAGGRLTLLTMAVFDEAVLIVRDTGCGIPPELQEKVFQLYFTTKTEGSGIGLAMTFQVVQLHNGILEFSSEVGKGTTFRLRFPLLAGPALLPSTEEGQAMTQSAHPS